MIRFESNKSAGFSMLDRDAKHMLELIKHSGAVPGAIRAEDIGAALKNLQDALKAGDADNTGHSDPAAASAVTEDQEAEQDAPVGLSTRAYPLLQLLEAAQSKQETVMWDYDNSVI